jgi:hypothetical protein
MTRRARSGLYILPILAAFSGCGVDERALTYEYHALDAGGAQASAGHANAGASNAGDSHVGNAGMADAGDPNGPAGGGCMSCGGNAEAGAPAELGGNADAASGNGGSVSSGAGGRAAAGSSGSMGSGGHAAAAADFPCGDLNQNVVDDCQETLVTNSRFDSALAGWDTEPSTTQVWDTSNGTGRPGSGSIQLNNASPVEQAVGSATAGSHQCIPVTPSANYDFGARVMLAAGQAGGQAGVNVWLFDDDACHGNLVSGNTPISGGVAGTWTALKGTLWIPGGVHSVYVRLVAIKPFAQPSLSVLIDDVLVAKRN